MFSGIGIWEVLLIIVVVLIVLGPHKVPEIARKLGQIVRTIRRASTDLSAAVTRELEITKDNSSPNKEKSRTASSSSDSGKTTTGQHNEQPAKPEGQQQNDE